MTLRQMGVLVFPAGDQDSKVNRQIHVLYNQTRLQSILLHGTLFQQHDIKDF